MGTAGPSELVDDLYYFRDHYFESHGVEDAGRSKQDVLEEREKTLQQMGEINVCSQGLAQALMLKGKVLNITPDYSPQAEELLAKAVKLDPEVWKNKVLLKNLSMVLQQLQAESAEHHAQNVMDSIQQAKLAVQMDMQDSHLHPGKCQPLAVLQHRPESQYLPAGPKCLCS
ncbi:unnamed protein product, partial [Natator depressus]